MTIQDAISPVRDKKNLRLIMLCGVVLSAIFIGVVGLICAWFFNGSVEPLCTLNWRAFTGIAPSGWVPGDRTWYAWLLCKFITISTLTQQIP